MSCNFHHLYPPHGLENCVKTRHTHAHTHTHSLVDMDSVQQCQFVKDLSGLVVDGASDPKQSLKWTTCP